VECFKGTKWVSVWEFQQKLLFYEPKSVQRIKEGRPRNEFIVLQLKM